MSRRLLATVAFVTAAASLLLLVVAHIARPDIPVLTSVVSQYAVGPYGWLQTLVFATLAVSCLALFVLLLRVRLSVGGRIGTWLLLAASIGLALAAVFALGDPMHEVASMIGNLSLPFGILLVGVPSLGIPQFGLIVAIFGLVFIASLGGYTFNAKEVLILAVCLAVGSYGAFVWALNLQFPVWPSFITG